MVKFLALATILLVVASCNVIPRDDHPERTRSPQPLPIPVMTVL